MGVNTVQPIEKGIKLTIELTTGFKARSGHELPFLCVVTALIAQLTTTTRTTASGGALSRYVALVIRNGIRETDLQPPV